MRDKFLGVGFILVIAFSVLPAQAQTITVQEDPKLNRFVGRFDGQVDCARPIVTVRVEGRTTQAASPIADPAEELIQLTWSSYDRAAFQQVYDACGTSPGIVRILTEFSDGGRLEHDEFPGVEWADWRQVAPLLVAGNSSLTGVMPVVRRDEANDFVAIGKFVRVPYENTIVWKNYMRALDKGKNRPLQQQIDMFEDRFSQVCDVSILDRSSMPHTLAALLLARHCSAGLHELELPLPESVPDPAIRAAYTKHFGTLIAAALAPAEWLNAMPESQIVALEAYMLQSGDSQRLVLGSQLDPKRTAVKPELAERLRISLSAADRQAKADSVEKLKQYREQEKRKEAEKRAADEKARAARLDEVRPLADGPSAMDMVNAIRNEHFAVGYVEAGLLGVMISAPTFGGQAAMDAQEFSIAEPTCSAQGDGAFQCSYQLTRKSLTATFDESGAMATYESIQSLTAALVGAPDVNNFNLIRVDTFLGSGDDWRSPTWAMTIKDRLEAQGCHTVWTTEQTEVQDSQGNTIGYLPKNRAGLRCD